VYFDGTSIDNDEYPELQPLLNSLLQALSGLFEYDLQDNITNQLVKIVDYYLSTIKYTSFSIVSIVTSILSFLNIFKL